MSNKIENYGLNALAASCHEAAKGKGFWDKSRETASLLMLIVSELSEAMEADRNLKYSKLPNIERLSALVKNDDPLFKTTFEERIKDTFEDELADVVIRVMDLCGGYGIDIESHVRLKMAYNALRPRLHGKSY